MEIAMLLPEIRSIAASSGPPGHSNVDDCGVGETHVSIPPHPLNIRPSGNKFSATYDSRNASGTFQILPDETLALLLEYLDSNSLRHLGSTCKALYAFSHLEDLWKTLLVEWCNTHCEPFNWRGSWRSTYLSLESQHVSRISCDSVFSDVLYRPFLCANTPLIPYTTNIPSRNAIRRLDNLSQADFASHWSDRPFILSKPVLEWPVFKTWETPRLLENFSDVYFRAEAVDWPLRTYVDYMNHNKDESPLYLFDRGFVEKMGICVGRDHEDAAYWIPDCFGEDLFAVLGDHRPDSRWLIVGPARSGSTFHKDPNATSAWNAILRGSKYWIMFPTNSPPPGVYVSEDQSEVTSPLSIAEWLIGFHAEARKTPGCLEGICNAGEVLHVPSGWWHLVVNLDASIAVTQNFVPRSHLSSVLSFLKDKPDQVSGFKKEISDPYSTFIQCMERQHPDLLVQAMSELEKKAGRKRKWDATVDAENEEKAFSFGFGSGGDSDDDIP